MSGSNGPGSPPSGNNPMAVASLVCGLAGFLCLIPGILGIVFGYIAKGQIRQSGGAQRGEGMATAGIVLGFVWVGLTVVILAAGSFN